MKERTNHNYALFTGIPLVGHINPLLREAEELQRRGWRVAVATAAEMKKHVEAESPDLPFVSIGELGPIAASLRKDQEAASKDASFVRGTMRIVRGLSAIWPLMFDGLTRSICMDRPDVLVVDLFSPAGLSVAEAQAIPAVINNPDLLACLPATMLPPADWTPFLFSGRSIHAVPWHQRWSGPFVRRFAAIAASLTVERQQNALRRSRSLPPISAHDLLAGHPILVNGVFGLEYPRPLPSSVEMVGPMLPTSVPSVSPELWEWLSNGPPVVYVNLGTLVVPPRQQLKKMIEAFETQRFRVYWIIKADQAANLPSPISPSVRLSEWGPAPIAVLAHPNVKVFVSHCGVNSAHEAMFTETPIVGIPMFADQRDMAVRVADAGAGIWLDKAKFTPGQLQSAIERVLNDHSFAESAAKVKRRIAAAGGAPRAAEVIERAVNQAV